MPVAAVRPMTVDVVRLLMEVLVGVGLPDRQLVRMVVVQIRMDMGVGMGEPVVMMGMDVLFADDEGYRGGHKKSRRGHRRPDPIAKDKDRGEGAGKWGQAE